MSWPNFWLFLGGYGYAIIGILFTFVVAVVLMRHTDRCDNCIFGNDSPFEGFATATLGSKVIVIIAYHSILIWPITILMLFVMMLIIKYERWFAKPEDLRLTSLVRAWLKQNGKSNWTTQISPDGNNVEHYFVGKTVAARIITTNTSSFTANPIKFVLLNRYGAYDDAPIQETQVSAADPLLFKKIKDFINNVSETYEH